MNSGLCILQDAVGAPRAAQAVRARTGRTRSTALGRRTDPTPAPRPTELAQHLLELRANLDRPRHGGGQEKGRRLCYRLLNEEQSAETSEC